MIRSRILTRVLVLVVTVLTAGALHASPALAGDAGLHCTVYYFHNDPSVGWGFTVCIKLEHDPANHQWRANGSVATTTPGMVLLGPTSGMVGDPDLNGISIGHKPAAVSQILGIASTWVRCSGRLRLQGFLNEMVTWPNGVRSSNTTTYTFGDDGTATPNSWISATC